MLLRYDEFRKAYPAFVFEGYSWTLNKDFLEIDYNFSITGLSSFKPHWKIKILSGKEKINSKTLQKMIFSLGLTELISYWKITCSPDVLIKAGRLTAEETDWWKEQYYNGLGEFFHVNGISADKDSFMNISSSGEEISGAEVPVFSDNASLIPIGGGKDSAVTLELLKEFKDSNFCYIINPRGATVETAKAGGYGEDRTVTAFRTLDKNMLELNKKGFLNGHTPFSAIVAFSGILAAYLNDIKYVVLSNESSANESTVKGSTVNHQYSKSFKFEKDFHDYESRNIKSGVFYFSMLRPLSEFQIAKYFSKITAYHHIFKSCNAGSKADIWCCKCPKCLFVFLILSPFMDYDYLCGIFGDNLLNNINLYETLEKLTGITEEKPFECVGSRDEINAAACITINNFIKAGKEFPCLLKKYSETKMYEQYKNQPDKLSDFYDKENLLPKKYKDILMRECYASERK